MGQGHTLCIIHTFVAKGGMLCFCQLGIPLRCRFVLHRRMRMYECAGCVCCSVSVAQSVTHLPLPLLLMLCFESMSLFHAYKSLCVTWTRAQLQGIGFQSTLGSTKGKDGLRQRVKESSREGDRSKE